MFNGKKRYWLFQFLGWGTFFLMHLFFAWFYGKLETEPARALFVSRALIFTILGIIITHLMRMVILRSNLLEKRFQPQVAAFLALTLSVAFICGLIELETFRVMKLTTAREGVSLAKRGFLLVALSNAVSWFVYIFIWNAIYLIYHYIMDYQRQQIDTLQLKSLVKELELKTIKSHINPHFIFNSLNSIRALVEVDPQRARNAITELSNLLRSSINIHRTETVLLKEEMNIVEDYLALEYMRFEDRLNVQYQIEPETLEKLVPPMMLQTLVENAIKHGISQEVKGGLVKISSGLKNGNLELSVENTGHLEAYTKEDGFGLKATTERLKLLYGERSKFEIFQQTPHLVRAKLTIPVS
jgi:two-component sensor histidine kinase